MVKLMLAKNALIFIAIMILASGCHENRSESGYFLIPPPKQTIKTPTGLAEYLKSQHLPTVESVENWNPPQANFSEGLKIKTAHYEVFTTLKDPLMLQDVPAFIETCFNNFRSTADGLSGQLQTTSRFTIYLFDNRTQWQSFTRSFAGSQSQTYSRIKAGAYYLNGACIAYNIGRERTFRALGHECWHQFVDRAFVFRLPSWLNEGIAMQFESNVYKNGLFYFEPAENSYRLDSLKKTFEQNQIIPLETLLESDPGDLLGDDPQVSAFYSQCYALVRFLREADAGKRKADFNRLLAGALEGKWPLSDEDKKIASDRTIPLTSGWNKIAGPLLFKHYFAANLDGIEKQYLDFCRDITIDK
jgi:hypothetical protein